MCAADFFLGDLEDLLLGVVQHEIRLLVRGVGVAQDVIAGGDELPEHRLFADDAGVVGAMGGRGNFVQNRGHVGGAADFFVEAALDQFLAHDDGVDRAVLLVQLDQRVVR